MSKKDTISKLKEEKEKLAHNNEEQNDDEEEAEEQGGEERRVVKEQSESSANKAKSLKDILGDSREVAVKAKTQKAKKNTAKDGKPRFINSKKANQISTGFNANYEIKKDENKKPQFTNSKKVGEKKMEAPKTKNYLEKDYEKSYKEDIDQNLPKPEFKGRSEGEEKFSELNTGDDLFLKNMTQKDVQIKNEYNNDDHPKKKKKKKLY